MANTKNVILLKHDEDLYKDNDELKHHQFWYTTILDSYTTDLDSIQDHITNWLLLPGC